MKSIFQIVSGIMVGMIVFYFSQDWKEEKLVFTLSEPAVFGDTTFQNLEIHNEGFDPATNVKLYLTSTQVGSIPKFVSKFDISGDGQSLLGGFERIRRGERVVVSFSTSSAAISKSNISIKSDRSVATAVSVDQWIFDQRSFWMGFGASFVFFMFLGVVIPAYKDYTKRAQLAKLKRDLMAHDDRVGKRQTTDESA